jgi:hypothetical protein
MLPFVVLDDALTEHLERDVLADADDELRKLAHEQAGVRRPQTRIEYTIGEPSSSARLPAMRSPSSRSPCVLRAARNAAFAVVRATMPVMS